MTAWTIEKEESTGGATFGLRVGFINSPEFVYVAGLSREQAGGLSKAVRTIETSARKKALGAVRDALEIEQR